MARPQAWTAECFAVALLGTTRIEPSARVTRGTTMKRRTLVLRSAIVVAAPPMAWFQNRQRITEPIWWYRHSGTHSAEPLRLGKQTLCQLSYSRSVHARQQRLPERQAILAPLGTLQRPHSV